MNNSYVYLVWEDTSSVGYFIPKQLIGVFFHKENAIKYVEKWAKEYGLKETYPDIWTSPAKNLSYKIVKFKAGDLP